MMIAGQEAFTNPVFRAVQVAPPSVLKKIPPLNPVPA